MQISKHDSQVIFSMRSLYCLFSEIDFGGETRKMMLKMQLFQGNYLASYYRMVSGFMSLQMAGNIISEMIHCDTFISLPRRISHE